MCHVFFHSPRGRVPARLRDHYTAYCRRFIAETTQSRSTSPTPLHFSRWTGSSAIDSQVIDYLSEFLSISSPLWSRRHGCRYAWPDSPVLLSSSFPAFRKPLARFCSRRQTLMHASLFSDWSNALFLSLVKGESSTGALAELPTPWPDSSPLSMVI